MNLQNFKEVYTKIITESTDDSDLRNYIRTIVEEVLVEENEISITKRKYPKLRAAIKDISDPGYRRFPIITSYATEAELDKFEKLLSTKDGLQNAELKKFMKRFEPRGISGTKSYPRNPSQDEFGYPDSFKSLDPFVYSKEELIGEAEGRLVEKNEDGINDNEFYGIDPEKHEKMYGMSKKSKVFKLGLKPSDKTLQTIIDRHARTGFILRGESGVMGEDNTGIEVTYNQYTKEYTIFGVEFYGGEVDSSERILKPTKDSNKLLTDIKQHYNSWIK